MELLFPGNRSAQLEILLEFEEKKFRDALKSDEELEVLKTIRMKIKLLKEQIVNVRQHSGLLTINNLN